MKKKSSTNTNKAAERIGQIVTQSCGRDAEIIAFEALRGKPTEIPGKNVPTNTY